MRQSVAVLALVAALATSLSSQDPGPAALTEMVNAERAFAQRATVAGWKQAFLDYFADGAVGFDGGKTVSAKEQIAQVPDPPKDAQLIWGPRYGDIAASGELGWLTGPSTSINPARNSGTPRYGNYASIWKRQADGTFKVLIDVGVNLPMEAPFAPGFVRAPATNRFRGTDSPEAAEGSLRDADRAFNEAARNSQAAAATGRLAAGARFHRFDVMPLTTERAILDWLAAQPRWDAADTRFVEVARSRDLGYTYGTYTAAPGKGFYVRAWTREGNGAWKIALDVLQPQ